MFQDLLDKALMLVDLLVALGIVAGSVALGWLARQLLRWISRRARKTTTQLDDMILSSLHAPVVIMVVILGIYCALWFLPLKSEVDSIVRRGLLIALVAVGIYAGLAVANALLRWYAKEIAVLTKTALDDRLIPLVRAMVLLTGSFLGVLLILRMLDIENDAINTWLAGHGVRILVIFVVAMIFFFALSRMLPRVIKDTIRRSMVGRPESEVEKRSETLANILVTTGQLVIIATTLIMILVELAPDKIAPFLAGFGVVGVAVGFGAQGLVKDIIAGLFIIMEGQYHVGDVVKIADVTGLVENMNLRRTVLRDFDGTVHHVPNGEIKVASNLTKEYSRVNVNIGVSYNANLDRAIAVINQVGAEMAKDPIWGPAIIKAPQVARIDSLGASSVDIKVVGDTKPMRQWDITGQLLKRVKEAFDVEGIEIPWPHTKVYFGDSPMQVKIDGAEFGRVPPVNRSKPL
ncbi:MAG: mechanosensitive ion channel family protein [Chloroflexi bacterium]|nr:mechanosensitive ion channel family protein [Chloroflexota bacterium]